VDATLIAAPPSVKNQDESRDSEMHQTKKGNHWSFGIKLNQYSDGFRVNELQAWRFQTPSVATCIKSMTDGLCLPNSFFPIFSITTMLKFF
jgi:hypothetical protein